MKLDEWHKIRDEVLTEKTPLRLDCLNPFVALQLWRDDSYAKEASALELKSAFYSAINLPNRPYILTKGVRSSLRTIMNTANAKTSRWWIPKDIFPTYLSIAQEADIKSDTYITWPQLELKKVIQNSNDKEFILLPVPHSPTGRTLSANEVNLLLKRLSESPSSYLVLDLVYAYHHLDNPELQRLAQSKQTILMFSTSKTWLQRCLAGITIVPEELLAEAQTLAEVPDPLECGLAVHCLQSQPNLPSFQNKKFQEQWHSLSESINSIALHWEPPETGYLSIINLPWHKLLEDHNILTVPPELFGLSKKNYSIISCLHDIAK